MVRSLRLKESMLVDIARTLVANSSQKTRSKHVAFVMYKGRVVAIGRNRNTAPSLMSPVASKKNGVVPHRKQLSVHAEIDALKKVDLSRVKHLSMLVLRIRADGTLIMSAPCKSCIKVLKRLGISVVRHSTQSGEIATMFL